MYSRSLNNMGRLKRLKGDNNENEETYFSRFLPFFLSRAHINFLIYFKLKLNRYPHIDNIICEGSIAMGIITCYFCCPYIGNTLRAIADNCDRNISI